MTTATDPCTWTTPSPADTEPGPGQPIPFTLTAKAHAALDQDGTTIPPVDLRQIARHLEAQLRANRRPAITDANALDVQALCVAEEAGELVGAYRRWAGKARRAGTRRDLEDEVADVLIVTACFAERAGIDLHAALAAKLTVIYSRGWREDDTAAAPGLAEWGCERCGAAYLGTPPDDGRCHACRAGEDGQ
jgi:NTP pyrophosphatase (non-canonical NTP hydrolase)